MQYPNDSRRCLTVLDQDSTLIAVIEMSLSSWLVAGIVPGIERQPLKKLEADKHALLKLLHRWRPNRERESLVGECSRLVNRMKAAFVRLGIRGFNPKLKKAPERLGALRTPEGEPIPPNTVAALRRDMERLRLVREHIRQIELTRLEQLQKAPEVGAHAMVRLLARVMGIGIETADMLVQEVLSRELRDRRAVARYSGLTGSPDESGRKHREKGLARAGNARVRRGMIQLAWRFLMFQKSSALAQWFRQRTENAPRTRKTMIVALARKLLIALWRFVREGVVPEGIVLRPAP
jgi:transposase